MPHIEYASFQLEFDTLCTKYNSTLKFELRHFKQNYVFNVLNDTAIHDT